jgi:hypothetical protein
MSKYSTDELQLAIGQDCTLFYYSDEITGTLMQITGLNRGIGYETVVIKTKDQHIKEAFFIHRIKCVPFLDTLRESKLWSLLFEE